VLYLSPVWHSLPEAKRPRFGYIQNLYNGGVAEGIRAGYPWLLDNGAFSDKWNESTWLAALDKWKDYAGTCIAAVVPDVVGDAAATMARFDKYAPVIRAYGYPVAFVTQDGLRMEDVPWDSFDVLFVGGTDEHKFSDAYQFILEAKRRGVWVHVGRVNSAIRLAEHFWMADSADGTTLSIEPSIRNFQRILGGVAAANAKKGTIPLWDMS